MGKRAVLLVLLSLGGCAGPPLPPTPEVQGPLARFHALRNYGETLVGIAARDFEAGSMRRRTAEMLYGRAAAEGNAFVDLVQANLTAGVLAEADLDPQAKRIDTALREFEAYVASGGGPHPPPKALVGEVPGLVQSVVEAGLAIWKAAKEQQAAEVARLNAMLDEKRWKSWSDLAGR